MTTYHLKESPLLVGVLTGVDAAGMAVFNEDRELPHTDMLLLN